METKQRNYICREQEYRNVIRSLKEQIDRISQKPYARVVDKSQDQIQLDKINISLSKGAAGHACETPMNEDEDGASKAVIEQKPDKRQVNETWNDFDEMHGHINQMQKDARDKIARYRRKFQQRMDHSLAKTREELEFNQAQKQQMNDESGDREKSLAEQLDLMT